jgi:hypothetical protein
MFGRANDGGGVTAAVRQALALSRRRWRGGISGVYGVNIGDKALPRRRGTLRHFGASPVLSSAAVAAYQPGRGGVR